MMEWDGGMGWWNGLLALLRGRAGTPHGPGVQLGGGHGPALPGVSVCLGYPFNVLGCP